MVLERFFKFLVKSMLENLELKYPYKSWKSSKLDYVKLLVCKKFIIQNGTKMDIFSTFKNLRR